jgi:large subunit ribosomal protein L17
MPRPSKGPRLGAGPAHERAILRGLSRSLIEHGRIVTTETKAKRVRPFVEKLITKARKGGIHNRRLVLAEIGDKRIVHYLFDRVAPRAGDRPGGYTRIMKLGPRRGDATPMAIIELVDAPHTREREPIGAAPKAEPRRRLRRRRGEGAEAELTDAPEMEAAAPEAVAEPEPEPEVTPEPEPEPENTPDPEPETTPEPEATTEETPES